MDNLRFLASCNSIKKVAISLKTTEKTVFRQRLSNTITYNITKTEAILFFKSPGQKAKKEIAALKLVFKGEKVKFNDKTTRLLGVWLDSKLIFAVYIKKTGLTD